MKKRTRIIYRSGNQDPVYKMYEKMHPKIVQALREVGTQIKKSMIESLKDDFEHKLIIPR